MYYYFSCQEVCLERYTQKLHKLCLWVIWHTGLTNWLHTATYIDALWAYIQSEWNTVGTYFTQLSSYWVYIVVIERNPDELTQVHLPETSFFVWGRGVYMKRSSVQGVISTLLPVLVNFWAASGFSHSMPRWCSSLRLHQIFLQFRKMRLCRTRCISNEISTVG